MALTTKQQEFVKQELIDIIWGNLSADWASILHLISENAAEEFEDLNEEDVYEDLRETLNCVQSSPTYVPFALPLLATYQNK